MTDNYVIVSSRRVKSGLTTIDFWQFVRPTSIGYPIFYNNINHIHVGSPSTETQIILEHTSADNYLAGYKVIGYSRMTLLQLTAPGVVVGALDIFGDEFRTLIPIDIKYHKYRNVIDILARNEEYRSIPDRNYVPMQIYHVTYSNLNGYASSGKGTQYFDHFLWSIDPTLTSTYFVASGGQLEIARFFRYNFYQWKSCPDRFEYRCEVGKPEKTLDDSHVNYLRYVLEVEKKQARKTYDIPFPVICAE